jgi:hypothetical protein
MNREVFIGDKFPITAIIFTPKHIATGPVIFKSGNITLGVCRLDNEGSATIMVNSNKLGIGVHSIQVFYPGDKKNRPSQYQFDFLVEVKSK